MTREVTALFCMCACGIACAVVFDMFRAAHAFLKKHDIAVIISDALYWVIAASLIILTLWYSNTGVIRAYEFVGLVLGAVIYFCTVSAYIYRFFLSIDTLFVKIIGYICKLLLTPVQFLYKILLVSFGKARDKLRKNRTISGG